MFSNNATHGLLCDLEVAQSLSERGIKRVAVRWTEDSFLSADSGAPMGS